MRTVSMVLVLAALAACAMPQGGMGMKKRGGDGGLFGAMSKPAQETDRFVEETVEIVTVPPGAKVQVNDGFVGYAPVKALVRRYWRGEPGNMTLDPVKIEAFPSSSDGRCVQSALFGSNNAAVASPVTLNMNNCTAEYGQPLMPKK